MHCVISIVLRDWTAVHAQAQEYKQRFLQELSAGRGGDGIEHSPRFRATTGFLLVVDWEREHVLASCELPKPTGFALDGGKLHVALWDHDEIATLSGTQTIGRIRHPFFNHIHTLEKTERGLLFASAGTDLLGEIDEHGELLWEYFLFEHGYSGRRFRFGQNFDRRRSYNRRYLPSALTTHPNCALRAPDDSILATLLCTGELVHINRRSGRCTVLLSGLHRPHAIRRRPGGYLLCDTEGGTIVLLDDDFRQQGQIPVNVPWIQDAVFCGDRLLAAGNRRLDLDPLLALAEAEGADNAVLELRGPTPGKKLSLGPDNRIFQVEPISARDAEQLAETFGQLPQAATQARWLRG